MRCTRWGSKGPTRVARQPKKQAKRVRAGQPPSPCPLPGQGEGLLERPHEERRPRLPVFLPFAFCLLLFLPWAIRGQRAIIGHSLRCRSFSSREPADANPVLSERVHRRLTPSAGRSLASQGLMNGSARPGFPAAGFQRRTHSFPPRRLAPLWAFLGSAGQEPAPREHRPHRTPYPESPDERLDHCLAERCRRCGPPDGHSQHCHHCPRRPRQDHAGRRPAAAERRVSRKPIGRRLHPRLERAGVASAGSPSWPRTSPSITRA